MREILAKHIAAGDIETGAQLFVDSLGGPATWAHRTSDQKQITLDNIGTAVKPEGRPVTTCEEIAKFDFPILLLNGERSPKRYGLMFAEMRKCKEIAEPLVIPNAAHSMNRDNPGRFNRAILEFLADH
jgi:pimeloyl-ACP methyl ester carboxylesterase